MNTQSLIPAVLALQFAAFGWRVNREISVGDEGRKTWLPIPDYLNIVSSLLVALFCVILPLAANNVSKTGNSVLAVAYILIVLHPVNIAAHYRLLFSMKGRGIYLEKRGGDYPYVTGQEIVTLTITIIFAIITGLYVYYYYA